jgi:hypothetical protein
MAFDGTRCATACFALATIAACQAQTPAPSGGGGGKSAALLSMEQVATAAYRCWFDSADAAFRTYSFANELNSFSGRPRFLLVPKNNFGGRPLLVVQAEGAEGRVSAFGPLMDGENGARIAADINRWRAGDSGCAEAA